MRLVQSLSCGLAIATLASSQFTILYFSDPNCGGRNVGCKGIPQHECCGAPPSRGSFRDIRATTSGTIGILVLTEPDSVGECGPCRSTGSLNSCYINQNPFNTAFMVEIPTSCARKELFDPNRPVMTTPQPVTNATATTAPSGCLKTHRPNVASVNGTEYYAHDAVYDAFMEDFVALIAIKDPTQEAEAEAALATKWADLIIGPGHPKYSLDH